MGVFNPEYELKLKNEIRRINAIVDKCGRRCYLITLRKDPLNKAGVLALPMMCDKAILLTHSTGLANKFKINITKEHNVSSSELHPNVDVMGCHLYEKINRRPGKTGIVGQAHIVELLLKKLKKYQHKEKCERIFHIGLVTTRRDDSRI